MNPRTRILMVIIVATFALIVVVKFFSHRGAQDTASVPPAALPELKARQSLSVSPAEQHSPVMEPSEQPDEEQSGLPKLSREKVEEYLTRHNRDAASLLAAFHELEDTNYLNEAATNFPGNPQVQWTILARNKFPEDRRKWLDAFKESSPDNSLADYLSAQDHFKNNQPDAAIKELLQASAKAKFTDYAMETYLGSEELSRFGGKPSLLAATVAMTAMSGELLPALGSMKGIANGILEVQKQYMDSGDVNSAQNLSELGLDLAERFTSGEGGRFLLSQIVGMAIESTALKSLEQNTPFDFLDGKTPAQRLDELKQQKGSLAELSRTMGTSFITLPEEEQNSYLDRVKTYGEVEALRWLHQRYGTNTP